MSLPIYEDAHLVHETRPIEVTITIKGDDSTYKQKHLIYEALDTMSEATVKKLIETARHEYHGEITEITVKMQINWQ